ncbi:MAG: 4-(cytidine 5'-diphospho)-2-C-methyl-D-erythritol kinase [Firmicutes bacterium]|nr:4-(cytidine 5'-diphospho)-2-C-methyl-D-erythritol kinase [Bacillota bacterium]
MNEITLKAYAKINLSLDVLGKLPNGYHEVKMVMQQVDLYDLVTVACEELPDGSPMVIRGGTTREDLPMDETNIAYKAAMLMRETYCPDKSFEIAITLQKHIPMAAGLAGGSADGAAVMRALAKLWELDVPVEELAALSGRVGSDVPFCLMGQEGQYCALATGTGTDLKPVRPLDAWIVLSKPPINVPTGAVYGNLKLDRIGQPGQSGEDLLGYHPDVDRMVRALNEEDVLTVMNCMGNVLETSTIPQYPVVGLTKKAMEDLDVASAVLMSGSGPTVFGVFFDKKKAESAYLWMKPMHKETFLVRTLV